MGRWPKWLVVAQSNDETPVQCLKPTALGLYGCMGHLVEHAPHHPVALGTTVISWKLPPILRAPGTYPPRTRVAPGKGTWPPPAPLRQSPAGPNRPRNRALRPVATRHPGEL